MPAPIIAAYEPYTEDRAPVELALAAAELTGAPVIAVAVYPWAISDGWIDPYADDDARRRRRPSAMQRLHDDLGVETRSAERASRSRARCTSSRASRRPA